MKLWLIFRHKFPFYPHFLHSLISPLTFMRSDRVFADGECREALHLYMDVIFHHTSGPQPPALGFTQHPLYPTSGISQVDAANWTR